MKKTTLLLAAGLMCSPWINAVAAPSDENTTEGDLVQTQVNNDNSKLIERIEALETQLNHVKSQQDKSLSNSNSSADWTKRVRLNGFATYGAQITDLNQKEVFYNSSGNSDGHPTAGTNNSWDQNGLSRAGLQITADLTDRTQLVTQFLARGKDSYHTSLQWGYLSHKITPNLTVRAGRLVLPFYMHSQYNDVSYAYPWPSLPDEVYSTVPGDTADGFDITWDFSTGPVVHSLNLQWTNTDVYAVNSYPFVEKYHAQNMINTSLSSTWDALTVRLGYSFSHVDHEDATARAIPPGLINGDELDMDHRFAYFANAGFRYDDGRLLLMSEWAQLDIHGYFPRTRSSYSTAGIYFGRWLPTVTYGRVDTSDHESPLAALGKFNTGAKQQKRWGYGLRYDVTNNVSIKGEVSHIFGFNGTAGLFSEKPNHHVNLFRFSVDAMF